MTDQPIPQVPRQTRPEPTQQDQQAIPAPPQDGGPHVLVYVPAQGYSWQPLPQIAAQMQGASATEKEQQQGQQGQGTTKPAGASTGGAQGTSGAGGTGGTMGTQGTSGQSGATGTTGAKERE